MNHCVKAWLTVPLVILSISIAGCGSARHCMPAIPALFSGFRTTERVDKWNAWAASHLTSGDIVFVEADSRWFFGTIHFSQFVRTACESPYSHVALVSIEDGTAQLYHMISPGVRKTSFGELLDRPGVMSAAIKRPLGLSDDETQAAVTFAKNHYRLGGEFDFDFNPDNERFYCTEFIEAAFRQSDVFLSDPVRVSELPGYEQVADRVRLLKFATGLSPDRSVFIPGNEKIGMWSSRHLRTTYEISAGEKRVVTQRPATQNNAGVDPSFITAISD